MTSTSRPSFEEVSARADLARGETLRPLAAPLVVVGCGALCILIALVLWFGPAGCLPPADCQPSTALCIGGAGPQGVPGICSSTGRTYAASEPRVSCGEVGGVCTVRGSTALCARPQTDGGAP